MNLWDLLFKLPIETALLFLLRFFGNLGVAIILLTLIIQLVLIPLRLPSLKSAQKIKQLEPELTGLKEKYKDDKVGLAKAQMELYQKHGINPLGGLLPTLLSIPPMIALYQVLLQTLAKDSFSTAFLWLNLSLPDRFWVLPILTGLSQFVLGRTMIAPGQSKTKLPVQKNKPSNDQEALGESLQAMSGQMQFFFPIFTALIVARVPAGVGLYWLTSLLFGIIQQQWMLKQSH